MKVHLYTLCYNEMKILPFAVDYWKSVADEIFVLDNGSTDGSVEYLSGIDGINVVHFNSDGFSDKTHRDLKNKVWKASRGHADWVIVCDLDEFLWSPEGIRKTLERFKDEGVTIVKPDGYNIYSEKFPEHENGVYLWDVCHNGVRDDLFNKIIAFSPNEITDINYTVGAHKCRPKGNIKWNWQIADTSVKLLHFKNLSLEYVLDRYKGYADRLSKLNKERRWGVQYTRPVERTVREFNYNLQHSHPVLV